MSPGVLQQRIREREQPSAVELGGLSHILEHGAELATDVYADRLVTALSTLEEELPPAGVELVVRIFEENSFPFVVASAAQHAARIKTDPSHRRKLQRCLLNRAAAISTAPQAEMASECLAGAFLFADLPGGSRPAVIAALDEVRPGDPAVLVRRASVLAGLAWLWHASPDLEGVLDRLSEDPDAGEQALYERSVIALDGALKSDGQERLLEGLNRAKDLFEATLDADPEMAEAEAFYSVLVALTRFLENDTHGVEASLVTAISTAEERSTALDGRSLRQWLRPRIDSELAWCEVASALRGLSDDLSKPSWLRAVPVLEQVAKLRRAAVAAATDAGDQLRQSITERIANSFLRHEGLKAHLQAWVEDKSTTDSDRMEGLDLLQALQREGQTLGNSQGLVGSPEPASPTTDESLSRLLALADLAAASGLNGVSESLFHDLDLSLSEHPDCVGIVRTDTRVLLKYLILFLAHCLDVTPAMAEGTFDFLFERDGAQPLEKELQRTLFHFLRLQAGGFPQHQIVRELPDVATGRADIAVVRPHWRIVVEIKRELDDCSRRGISKYLGQTSSYELTGPLIAFLVVLDLQSQKEWPLTLKDNCWVEKVEGPGDSRPRLVCVWRIPGARRPPSATKTPESQN